MHYDTPIGEHRGKWKTVELVARNYWWLGVTKEVGRYMDGCDVCQKYKNRSKALVGKLMPNMIPEKPWSHISVDFITKLPLAQGYNAILVVCDCFSKIAYFIATTEKHQQKDLQSCSEITYRSYMDFQKALYQIEKCSLQQE